MDILIGLLIGIVLSAVYLIGVKRLLPLFRKRTPLVLNDTGYDTRIDALTSSGMMRYALHKAMKDPARRKLLKSKPIYESAFAALGWEDEG